MLKIVVPSNISMLSGVFAYGSDQNGDEILYHTYWPITTGSWRTEYASSLAFRQGSEDIYGENSVTHEHQDGILRVYRDDVVFRVKTSDGRPGVRLKGERSIYNRPLSGSGKLTIRDDESVQTILSWETRGDLLLSGYYHTIKKKLSGTTNGYASLHVAVFDKDRNKVWYTGVRSHSYKANEETPEEVFHRLKNQWPTSAKEWRQTSSSWKDIHFHNNQLTDYQLRFVIGANTGRFIVPRKAFASSKVTHGGLAQQAIQNSDKLDLNGLAFISETIKFKELLPPIADIKKLDTFDLKAYSNVYLWLRYGLSLSVKDWKAVVEALPKLIESFYSYNIDKHDRYRARGSETIEDNFGNTWEITKSVRLLVEKTPEAVRKFRNTISNLYSLDVLPTLQNLWDLIPYSFVLDWIVPISELLDNIDTRARLSSMNILACTLGTKYKCAREIKDVHGVTVDGEIFNTLYMRTVSTSVPTFTLAETIESDQSSSGGIRRILDGSTLIIQRLS